MSIWHEFDGSLTKDELRKEVLFLIQKDEYLPIGYAETWAGVDSVKIFDRELDSHESAMRFITDLIGFGEPAIAIRYFKKMGGDKEISWLVGAMTDLE